MYRTKLLFLMWLGCLGFLSCAQTLENSEERSLSENDTSAQTDAKPVIADTSIVNKQQLTWVYTQAIGEFIKAAYVKDQVRFDTLYFGKHAFGQADDFPDIELPTIIENTPICLIDPGEGLKKQQEQASLVYVNLMGWVTPSRAEFIFVVFSNGVVHQYDYFIYLELDLSTPKFVLEKIEFQNYLNIPNAAYERQVIYEDGKYIGLD